VVVVYAEQAAQKNVVVAVSLNFSAAQAVVGSGIPIFDYNAVIAVTTGGFPMATMTIRNLDDDLKARLRLRAARHGRSMEEEARSILRNVLKTEPPTGRSLLEDIRALVEPFGGVELELPTREATRDPPEFR
jgi:plasmid stability protein